MSQEKETNQEMTEEKMTENTEETVKDSEVTEEASEETTEQEAAAGEDKDGKKSIFGKKKSKLEEKIAELEDARMRQLAESLKISESVLKRKRARCLRLVQSQW